MDEMILVTSCVTLGGALPLFSHSLFHFLGQLKIILHKTRKNTPLLRVLANHGFPNWLLIGAHSLIYRAAVRNIITSLAVSKFFQNIIIILVVFSCSKSLHSKYTVCRYIVSLIDVFLYPLSWLFLVINNNKKIPLRY